MNTQKHVAIKWFFPLFLLILIFSLSTIVQGQSGESSIDFQVEPAFEGNFKYGEWLPLWVTIENQGAAVEGTVQATMNTSGGAVSFASQTSLPTGSRKQFPLYILPNNYSREIVVQLLSSEEEVLAESTITVAPNQNNYFLVGIIAPERGPISLLTTLQNENSSRKVIMFGLDIEEIPEFSVALDSLDVLVLNDTDTSQLSPQQNTAIQEWVQNGGQLIIGGGPGAEKTISGLSSTLAPLSINNVMEIDSLESLESYTESTPIRVLGPFLVNDASYQEGSSVLQQEETTLIQKWPLGNGQIFFVSLDLAGSPFDAWAGTVSFWENIFSSSPMYPMWYPADMSLRQLRMNNMYYPLTNQPSLDLPSIRGIGILLLIYIILVGPVNYLILRGVKKLHLAWVTIPILTVLFTGGAFGTAFLMRGNDILVNSISLIDLYPDGSASLDSYVGVFSPSQETYTLEIEGSPFLSLSNGNYYDPWLSSSAAPTSAQTRMIQGHPSKVTGLSVDQWSMQSFGIESITTQLGKIESNLILDQNKLTGTIINNLSTSVNDVVLVVGSSVNAIGDIEPGETVDIDIDIQQSNEIEVGSSVTYAILDELQLTDYSSREFELKRSILDAAYQPFGYWIGPGFGIQSSDIKDQIITASTFLIGWIDQAPPEITIGSKSTTQNSMGMISYILPINLADGKYSLPPSMIAGALAEQPHDGGTCGGMSTNIYLGSGDAIFDFSIPAALLNTSIENILVSTNSDPWDTQSSDHNISIYNWDEDTWLALSKDSSNQYTIANSEGLIDSNGTIRVKLSLENSNMGGCINLTLSLDGTK